MPGSILSSAFIARIPRLHSGHTAACRSDVGAHASPDRRPRSVRGGAVTSRGRRDAQASNRRAFLTCTAAPTGRRTGPVLGGDRSSALLVFEARLARYHRWTDCPAEIVSRRAGSKGFEVSTHQPRQLTVLEGVIDVMHRSLAHRDLVSVPVLRSCQPRRQRWLRRYCSAYSDSGRRPAKTKHRSHPRTQRTQRGVGSTSDLGQTGGLLPRNHLTLESAIHVNLNNETARLPLYQGDAPVPGSPGQTEHVWYVLLDASDEGARGRSGRQLRAEAGEHRDQRPGRRADRHAGEPDAAGRIRSARRSSTSPARRTSAPAGRGAGTERVPAGQVPARRGGRSRLQPVHQDRRLGRHVRRADRRHRRRPVRRGAPLEHSRSGAECPHRWPFGSGDFAESYADLLFVKGFDAGQPILYLSTDAGQPFDRRSGALNLRSGPEQRVVQRWRRLPRLCPGASIRVHQRPDGRRKSPGPGLPAPGA